MPTVEQLPPTGYEVQLSPAETALKALNEAILDSAEDTRPEFDALVDRLVQTAPCAIDAENIKQAYAGLGWVLFGKYGEPVPKPLTHEPNGPRNTIMNRMYTECQQALNATANEFRDFVTRRYAPRLQSPTITTRLTAVAQETPLVALLRSYEEKKPNLPRERPLSLLTKTVRFTEAANRLRASTSQDPATKTALGRISSRLEIETEDGTPFDPLSTPLAGARAKITSNIEEHRKSTPGRHPLSRTESIKVNFRGNLAIYSIRFSMQSLFYSTIMGNRNATFTLLEERMAVALMCGECTTIDEVIAAGVADTQAALPHLLYEPFYYGCDIAKELKNPPLTSDSLEADDPKDPAPLSFAGNRNRSPKESHTTRYTEQAEYTPSSEFDYLSSLVTGAVEINRNHKDPHPGKRMIIFEDSLPQMPKTSRQTKADITLTFPRTQKQIPSIPGYTLTSTRTGVRHVYGFHYNGEALDPCRPCTTALPAAGLYDVSGMWRSIRMHDLASAVDPMANAHTLTAQDLEQLITAASIYLLPEKPQPLNLSTRDVNTAPKDFSDFTYMVSAAGKLETQCDISLVFLAAAYKTILGDRATIRQLSGRPFSSTKGRSTLNATLHAQLAIQIDNGPEYILDATPPNNHQGRMPWSSKVRALATTALAKAAPLLPGQIPLEGEQTQSNEPPETPESVWDLTLVRLGGIIGKSDPDALIATIGSLPAHDPLRISMQAIYDITHASTPAQQQAATQAVADAEAAINAVLTKENPQALYRHRMDEYPIPLLRALGALLHTSHELIAKNE